MRPLPECHLMTFILTNGNYIIGGKYLIKHTSAAFNVIYISVSARTFGTYHIGAVSLESSLLACTKMKVDE